MSSAICSNVFSGPGLTAAQERGFTEISLRYRVLRMNLAYTIGIERQVSGLDCCLEKTHMAPVQHRAAKSQENRVPVGVYEMLLALSTSPQ